MKKLLLPILGTVAFIIAVGLLVRNSYPFKTTSTGNSSAATTKTIKIGSVDIPVEIADTPAKRSLGLGQRSSLNANNGMLFVFEAKGVSPNFWMKDMQFPLDFIWIANGMIVKIDRYVSNQPGVPDAQLKVYSPGQPVDYVLEVNAGFADKNNFFVGEAVDLSKAL